MAEPSLGPTLNYIRKNVRMVARWLPLFAIEDGTRGSRPVTFKIFDGSAAHSDPTLWCGYELWSRGEVYFYLSSRGSMFTCKKVDGAWTCEFDDSAWLLIPSFVLSVELWNAYEVGREELARF
jgi:hypothetical protein